MKRIAVMVGEEREGYLGGVYDGFWWAKVSDIVTECKLKEGIYTTKLESYPAKSEKCEMDVYSKLPGEKIEEIPELDKQFDEIAVLYSEGWNKAVDAYKKAACLVGGDAMILIEGPHRITSVKVIKYSL